MRALLLFTGMMLCLAPAVAQVEDEVRIPYRHYGVADGLPHPDVLALAQSPNGLLWVGTVGGLSTFDGHTFLPVPLPDSLRALNVTDIAPLTDGSAWIALGAHVVHVRPRRTLKVIHLQPGQGRPFVLTRGNTVYIVTSGAYYVIPPDAGEPVRHPFVFPGGMEGFHPIKGVRISDAEWGPNGALWLLAHEVGPMKVQPDGTVHTTGAPPASYEYHSRYYDMQFTPRGDAIVTQGGRAFRFDPATGELTPILDNRVLDNRAYAIAISDGIAYIKSGPDFLRYDLREDRMLTPLGPQLGLPIKRTRRLLRNHEGSLWLGTTEGLLHLYAPAARQIETISGVPATGADFFLKGEDGSLWVETWGNGLLRIQPSAKHEAPDGIRYWGQGVKSPDASVFAIAFRRVYRYGGDDGWRLFHAFDSSYSRPIRGAITADETGYFWHNNGLFEHSFSGAPRLLFPWDADDRDQHAFTVASDGSLLVRAFDYLLRVRPNSVVGIDTLAHLKGYRDAGGRYLEVDDEGQVWIPLWNTGLLRVQLDSREPVVENVLPGRDASNVFLEGDGLALATSSSGLYVLDAATGRMVRRLTMSDGLISNSVRGAAVSSGKLYISNPNGITTLPASVVFDEPEAPRTLLTRLEVNFEDAPPAGIRAFDKDERNVGFSFAATSYRHTNLMRYEYRLVPGDIAWHESREPFTRYLNLEPGKYRFEVRARLGAGAPGPAATYSFAIPPFFYETWTFKALCMLLLLALCTAAYRLRTRAHRLREQELNRLVNERTLLLKKEKGKTEEQARRLAELDRTKARFFANISHEFRTPLTLLIGPLQDFLSGKYGEQTDAARREQRSMMRNARGLMGLVNQLLALASIEDGKMSLDARSRPLAPFTREIVERFAALAERRKLSLSLNAVDDHLRASFDAEKLEKVIGNLLSNALKFTPKGGKVRVLVHAADDKGMAEIVVKDTGPGIPPDDLERIFDRFRQVDGSATRRHVGTGIGLSLVKELVELHGGKVLVESEQGFGSAFIVRLPGEEPQAADEESEPASKFTGDGSPETIDKLALQINDGEACAGDGYDDNATLESEHYAPAASPSILVVEDNADVRGYLRRRLEAAYTIVEACNGVEGLKKAQAEAPDLIISDVMMPEMGGFALTEAIRADDALCNTPVILLTARAEEVDAVEGLGCGADDYLTKPFGAAELSARVSGLLKTRRRLRERYSREIIVEPTGVVVPSIEEEFLERVLAVIEENFADSHFSIDDLADAVGLSPRQCQRRIKEATGETPGALIRRMRLERAGQLVTEDVGSVSEIAYAVGFNSSSHFSQIFRKHFGACPSEY